MKFHPDTSTSDLVKWCEDLGIHLKFIGFNEDFIKTYGTGASIINLGSKGNGTHWCGLWEDNDESLVSYYFDSYGMVPFEEIKKIKKNIIYNDKDIQRMDSGYCGEYVIDFLYNSNKYGGYNALKKIQKKYKHYSL